MVLVNLIFIRDIFTSRDTGTEATKPANPGRVPTLVLRLIRRHGKGASNHRQILEQVIQMKSLSENICQLTDNLILRIRRRGRFSNFIHFFFIPNIWQRRPRFVLGRVLLIEGLKSDASNLRHTLHYGSAASVHTLFSRNL